MQSFEKDCEKHEIHQYYLIRATNENADRFLQKIRKCAVGRGTDASENIKRRLTSGYHWLYDVYITNDNHFYIQKGVRYVHKSNETN